MSKRGPQSYSPPLGLRALPCSRLQNVNLGNVAWPLSDETVL